MLSNDFSMLRHYLENELNSHSRIELTTSESIMLVENMKSLEERIIELENSVASTDQDKEPEPVRVPSNIVRIDHFKALRG